MSVAFRHKAEDFGGATKSGSFLRVICGAFAAA
jgi:hypothetical protein